MARFQKTFEQPFSGNVTQTINPWTWTFAPRNSSFSLVSLDFGPSGNPDVEAEIMRDVASYGRQIGRMQDVMTILVDRLESIGKLDGAEKDAVEDFRSLMREIGKVKKRHSTPE